MLQRVLEALGALLEDAPVFNRLIEQMKDWGKTQQAAREHLIRVFSNVLASFERAHAIVLLELSRLAAVRSPDEYKTTMAKEIDRDKLYELFKANDVCAPVHQLQADLQSGFADIKDSIALGAANKLSKALGDFELSEYALAEDYQKHLSSVLLSAFKVNTQDDLKQAISEVVDEQGRLSRELSALTAFKHRLLQLSLYS